MQVQDAMTRGPVCIRPDATLQEAAQMMKQLNCGSLPICDNDRLAGMITDRDITIRATAEGRDPANTSVRDVMTPKLAYCFDDQDVSQAAQIMEEKQIRRLPVLNRDKRLVGIVTLGDVAVRTHDEHISGRTLERVCETVQPR